MRNAHLVVGLLLLCCTQERRGQDISEVHAPRPSASESRALPPAQPPTVEVAAPVATASVASAARTTPSDGDAVRPEVLWQANLDLDGDGTPDEIRLASFDVRTVGSERADEEAAIPVRGCRNGAASCFAVLHVGKAERQIELNPGYFGGIDLSTIDIDVKDGRRELLFRRREPGFVDPAFLFTVGIYDGKQLHWQDLDGGVGYDAGRVHVAGNGVLATEYDACSEVTTTTYRLTKTALRRVGSTTKKVREPSQCAACPYVYVEVGGRFVKQGEILRNLRSEELNAHQTLPLELPSAARSNGHVRVQLREEKAETTYLDSIWLHAEGVDHAPVACDEQAYCTTDGEFHPLTQGQQLDLYFAVPPTVKDVTLHAVGHYVPVEPSH